MGTIIHNIHMFNPRTLNIFTDGSIRKMKHLNGETETIGCAGAYAVSGYNAFYSNEIEKSCTVIRGATNNITELMAIYEGLLLANKYRHAFDKINIISDSKINIMGLREWIFNWIVPGTDRLVSSTGGEPMNLQYIMQNIYYILDNELNIEFYHINGHKNYKNEKDLIAAYKTFKESNHIQNQIEKDLIVNLCIGNDIVDQFTGVIIEQKLRGISREDIARIYVPRHIDPVKVEDWKLPEIQPQPLIQFIYQPFDTNKYRKLIGG